MERKITTPLTKEVISSLHAGDSVLLTGTIYTARDAAHKRMAEALAGEVIGSAGPTTASRMDKYTPELLDLGLVGMIGKGKRSQAVKDAIVRNKAVYFAAIGGAGALLSRSITSARVIAYEDLGTEAIRELTVVDFPAIVVIDSEGTDLYKKVSYYSQG